MKPTPINEQIQRGHVPGAKGDGVHDGYIAGTRAATSAGAQTSDYHAAHAAAYAKAMVSAGEIAGFRAGRFDATEMERQRERDARPPEKALKPTNFSSLALARRGVPR